MDAQDPEDRERFQERVVEFFEEEGRDFPWRFTDNELHALVAEVMLQQTSYYQVQPAYEEFCDRFQDPRDVLEAEDRELRRFFQGLGLQNRAEYVRAIATFLASDKELTQENLLRVKGLGRYSVNAFLSTHEGERLPIVDGNVKRVFQEFFGYESEEPPSTDEELWRLAERLLPEENVREYNLGLIDYGAELWDGNPDER